MIVSIRQQFEHLFSGDIMKADKAADCSAAFLSACAGMALEDVAAIGPCGVAGRTCPKGRALLAMTMSAAG